MGGKTRTVRKYKACHQKRLWPSFRPLISGILSAFPILCIVSIFVSTLSFEHLWGNEMNTDQHDDLLKLLLHSDTM